MTMEGTRYAFHDDAVYLIEAARSSARQPVTFFDEIDQVVHTFEDGVLEIGTDYTDYRSYYLALDGGELSVVLRIPNGEQSDEYPLDQDDEEDLAQRLAQLARPMRMAERLAHIDVAALWNETMAALFRHDPTHEAPQDAFERENLEGAIHDVLEQSARLTGWEWKTFGEEGVERVNALLGAELPFASAEESRRVFRSDDLSPAVLGWFDRRLAPLGWALVAISPFDEYQSFALLRRENVDEVRSLFEQLGVQSMAALPTAQ